MEKIYNSKQGDIEVTVVIPVGFNRNADITLKSLLGQTMKAFDVVIVDDDNGKGASWARNRGFDKVRTPYVLFSDDDIGWEIDAIETMHKCLSNSNASYCYGSYWADDRLIGDKEFNADELREQNYISTMSLIRSKDFTGFDIRLKRLQDWDLWLTMLGQGKIGIYCGKKTFSTSFGEGISSDKNINYDEASDIVLKKHGLLSD